MKLPVDYNKLTPYERKLVREEYIQLQNNLCKHCNESLSCLPKENKRINWKLFPLNFKQYPIHLHHNHKTGMTIGAVHMKCNAILFQYYGE